MEETPKGRPRVMSAEEVRAFYAARGNSGLYLIMPSGESYNLDSVINGTAVFEEIDIKDTLFADLETDDEEPVE